MFKYTPISLTTGSTTSEVRTLIANFYRSSANDPNNFHHWAAYLNVILIIMYVNDYIFFLSNLITNK